MPDVEINQDSGKNLWSNLLQEVKEKSSKTCNLPISLLVLGNEGCGKSSLIARLQKLDIKHGVGLEFDYIEVKDESTDENKKLNVWISSGDTYHTNLLKYALNEANFGYSCCMIIVSLSEPWNLIDSLEEWLRNLKMHIDRLKLNHQDMQFFKDTLNRQFQEYCEPDLDNEKQIVGKRRDTDFNFLHPSVTDDSDKILVPLDEGVFENNLGLPIMVVITKTDNIFTLEQNFDYNDDKFDFIQMHLRKICLKYGAALCYTSLKDDRNCDLLLNYLLHRCYGFPMINTASVIEKDAIFIPAGWDNNKKINILSENLMDDVRKQSYSSLINKPLSLVRATAQNRLTEPEVAEDEQVFLMKQQALIQRIKAMGSADGNIKDVSRSGSSMTSSPGSRSRKNLPGLTSSSGNTSNTGAQQANEGVLANFFSSLLNKRGVSTGSPLPNQQPSVGDLSHCDSAASEVYDSQRDEILSNSNSNNADLIQTIHEESNEILNPGKITATSNVNKFELSSNNVDETKEQSDTDISEPNLALNICTNTNVCIDETNINNNDDKDPKSNPQIPGNTKIDDKSDFENTNDNKSETDKQHIMHDSENIVYEDKGLIDNANINLETHTENVINSEIDESNNQQQDFPNNENLESSANIFENEDKINENIYEIEENIEMTSNIEDKENIESEFDKEKIIQGVENKIYECMNLNENENENTNHNFEPHVENANNSEIDESNNYQNQQQDFISNENSYSPVNLVENEETVKENIKENIGMQSNIEDNESIESETDKEHIIQDVENINGNPNLETDIENVINFEINQSNEQQDFKSNENLNVPVKLIENEEIVNQNKDEIENIKMLSNIENRENIGEFLQAGNDLTNTKEPIESDPKCQNKDEDDFLVDNRNQCTSLAENSSDNLKDSENAYDIEDGSIISSLNEFDKVESEHIGDKALVVDDSKIIDDDCGQFT